MSEPQLTEGDISALRLALKLSIDVSNNAYAKACWRRLLAIIDGKEIPPAPPLSVGTSSQFRSKARQPLDDIPQWALDLIDERNRRKSESP